MNILRRYSSPVDTGIVVVQSSDLSGSGRMMSIDALFFTRVHFDIFGTFFPHAVPDLDSTTKLLMDVYSAENLTFCVASTELSSSSSLFSSSQLHSRCINCSSSLNIESQTTDVYVQELATLRRFSHTSNQLLIQNRCRKL